MLTLGTEFICEIGKKKNEQSILKRNGTPSLCDVLPFEINNENYYVLIGIITRRQKAAGYMI